MFRKLSLLLLVLLMPALACAANMQVTSSVLPALGGSISPSGIRQFPGPAAANYTITVNPGYAISSVRIDNVDTGAPYGTTYSIPYVSGTVHTIRVTFFQPTFSITTTAGPGGQIQITGGGSTFIPAGASRTIIVAPSTGYKIHSYIVDGGVPVVPADPMVAVSIPFVNIQANHSVSATFDFVPAVTVYAGPNQTLTANSSGAASTTLTGSATSNSGAITYEWNVTVKPVGATATFGSSTSAITTFDVTGIGTYQVTLTATSGGTSVTSAPATISVLSTVQAAAAVCTFCHITNVETVQWQTSPHGTSLKTTAPACPNCHNPGLLLEHPGYDVRNTTANPGLYYSCITCHFPGSTKVASWPPPGLTFHNAYNGTNRCVQCHNPHTTVYNGNLPYPHFANSTTSAQYVNTPNISCDNCHSAVDAQGVSSFNVYSANLQWAQTGKANPKSPAYVTYQFKSMGTPAPANPANSTANDCVRCHTTTGYINYVSSNFATIAPFGPALGSREMVACPACHYTPFNSYVDPATGTSFNRRVVGVEFPPPFNDGSLHVIGYYGYSSAQSGKAILSKVFDDKGDSNICITCHSGKAAGSNITTVAGKVGATGSFWQNVQFMSSHYMPSAGILFQVPPRVPPGTGLKIGYEYRAISEYTPLNFAHPAIGDGVQGPCVGCHMDGSVRKHLFSPVSSSQGVIKAITSTTCFTANCHVSPGFNASYLQTKKEGYQASMAVIAALLGARGIYFNPVVYPYFFTTSNPALQNFGTRTLDWTRTINSVNFGSAVMGAAFNLKLLQTDSGSWAHNDVYTKRLLYDTIDFLDDGVQNNTVYNTIQDMTTIDQTTKTRAQGYITPRPQ